MAKAQANNKSKLLSLEESLNRLQLSEKDEQIGREYGEFLRSMVTLRTQRKKRGLTQVQLAQLAGVPRDIVSQLENGKRNAKLTTVAKVAKVLDLKIALIPNREATQ